MSKRIVIVGGVAAGATAAAKARRTIEQAEIVLLEAGPHVSFATCGLPYYVGGEIANRDDLFVVTPGTFRRRLNIDLRLSAKAVSVSPSERTVTVAGKSGRGKPLTYDRLILATGAVPIAPPIEGLEGPNVFTCRNVGDADAILERIGQLTADPSPAEGQTPGRALIIGGGYVGLECAEQLLRRGFGVTVAELMDQLMGPLDPEMALPIQLALEQAGAEVILNDGVARIERDADGRATGAVLQGGRRVGFDLAVVALGVRPNVSLAEAAGLKLGPTGAVAVDARQRTSDPAIYAAGDNCESVFLPTGRPANIALAGPANKQGRVAGANAALDLAGADEDDPLRLSYAGTLGTAVVRVRETVAAMTGLSEKLARSEGIDAAITYAPGASHAGYYPGAEKMLIKLIYAPVSGRLLGAQVVGGDGVDKRIDVLATAIGGGMSVEDLEQLDLGYSPPLGSSRDVVIQAGSVASNARRGIAPGIGPAELLDELAGETPPLVLDVRSRGEYDGGHLPDTLHIPIEELRRRIAEVPADRPVVVHCSQGYRSYLAQQVLRHHGRGNVRNLLGGFSLLAQVSKLRNEG